MKPRSTFPIIAALWLAMGALVVLCTACQSIPAPVPPPYDDAPYIEPGPAPEPITPPPEDLEEQEAPDGTIGPAHYSKFTTGATESDVLGILGQPEGREPATGYPAVLRWPAANGEGILKTLRVTFGADGHVVERGKSLWRRAP